MNDDALLPGKHIDAAKRRLAHLGGLAAKTEAAEQRILEAAQERVEAVEADMQKLKGRALVDEAAADQYRALTFEHGQLGLVIAHARQALAA
jgi:hypothetical protein